MNNQDNKTRKIAGEADVNYGMQCFRQRKFEEGFQAFMKAALKGHPGAMNNVSVCFYNGQGTNMDKKASFVWLKKSAEGGYTPAYYALAVKYINGDGTERSVQDAVFWAVKANVEGNVHQENAQKLLQKIEEMLKNSPAAQARQAVKDEVNQGVEFVKEKKYEEAYQCFLSAAQKGDVNAMTNLALCYSSGQGVERDEEKAFEWTKKAAEGGLIFAGFALAERYLNGKGTERSLEQAELWAKRVASVPNPLAQSARKFLEVIENEKKYSTEVLEAFKKGSELWQEKNFNEAIGYLETAGRGGHAAALRMIGFAYQRGLGVKANAAYAYQFLEAAAYRGDQSAILLIAHGFSSANKVVFWQQYGKDHNFEGCEKLFENHIAEEQKVKRGYSAALNAEQAMKQAAECFKTFEENPEQANQNPNMGAMAARPAFEKAMSYGNLDGVCGLASVYEKIDNPELSAVITDMYRIAAYMGHSYAMYQMGSHYDEIDKIVAEECYRQAAQWGYSQAQEICGQRGISWS